MSKDSDFFEVKEEKPSPQDDKKRRTVSFSQWADHENCPLQWKLKNIDKLKSPTVGIAAIFGHAMHKTIQEWLQIHYEDMKKAKLLDMSDQMKIYLIEEFEKNTIVNDSGEKVFPCTKEEIIEYYEDGCAILKHLRKDAKNLFPTKDHKLIGIESELKFDINSGLKFFGKIDLIILDEKNGIYHIVDLKTSTKGWSYHKKDPKKVNQVLLYKAFYSKLFNVDPKYIVPEFLILKRKIFEDTEFPMKRLIYFRPSHGTPSINKALKMWESFINDRFDENGVYKDNAVATPSKNACRFCEFKLDKEKCPNGYYKE